MCFVRSNFPRHTPTNHYLPGFVICGVKWSESQLRSNPKTTPDHAIDDDDDDELVSVFRICYLIVYNVLYNLKKNITKHPPPQKNETSQVQL